MLEILAAPRVEPGIGPGLTMRRRRNRTRGAKGWAAYGWPGLVGDAAGGFVSALIALPYNLAMAGLMGLPPELGILTSILSALVTAVLGRNPVLIGGTASATVPFIAAAVTAGGVGGSAKVCIAASIFLLIFGALRLGRFVARVPHLVVSGFSCGVGAMMVVLQLPALLGLVKPTGGWSSRPILLLGQIGPRLFDGVRARPLGLATIVVVASYLAHRRWPKSPAPLIGVIAAVLTASALGMNEASVGRIPLAIPPLAAFTWESGDVRTVLPDALKLAFVVAVNVLITSRVVEHFQGRHRPLRATDADRELSAYGIANLVVGLFGAPVSVGIPARSLANVRCGGTTRLSMLWHAAVLFSFVAAGSTLIARVPLAALAGVTAYVGINLLEWSTWHRLPRMRKLDAAAFLATAVAVVAADPIAAVAIGCGFYALRVVVDRLTHALAAATPADRPS